MTKPKHQHFTINGGKKSPAQTMLKLEAVERKKRLDELEHRRVLREIERELYGS